MTNATFEIVRLDDSCHFVRKSHDRVSVPKSFRQNSGNQRPNHLFLPQSIFFIKFKVSQLSSYFNLHKKKPSKYFAKVLNFNVKFRSN